MDFGLARVTNNDREYAEDMINDLEEAINDRKRQVAVAAQWLRKARYEAVIADRKNRPTEAMMPCPHCPADGFIIHRDRAADEDATPK